MKALTTSILVFGLVFGMNLIGAEFAHAQNNGNGYSVRGFVDDDGDGFNDLAPDHDNDGIPNGLDPDYNRPLDGSGNQFGNADDPDGDNMFQNQNRHMNNFYGDQDQGEGNGYGPGDGSGNNGDGPNDGSGNGPGGDGDCDGDGPKRP